MNDNFFDHIYEARNHPVLIFGPKKSLSDFAAYIQGFVAGRKNTDLGIDADLARFSAISGGFDEFVAKKGHDHFPVMVQHY